MDSAEGDRESVSATRHEPYFYTAAWSRIRSHASLSQLAIDFMSLGLSSEKGRPHETEL